MISTCFEEELNRGNLRGTGNFVSKKKFGKNTVFTVPTRDGFKVLIFLAADILLKNSHYKHTLLNY